MAEEYDAPWLTADIEKLDARWEGRCNTLHDHLKTEAKSNLREFQKIKAAQTHGAESIDALSNHAQKRFDTLDKKQDKMLV